MSVEGNWATSTPYAHRAKDSPGTMGTAPKINIDL